MISNNMTIFMQIITNDVSGPITDYSVTYLEQFNVIQSSLVESEPCDDDVCNFMFEKSVPSSICSSSSDINATVSATNRIGQGLSSEILTIGSLFYSIIIAKKIEYLFYSKQDVLMTLFS